MWNVGTSVALLVDTATLTLTPKEPDYEEPSDHLEQP
jgi:hypothetical protein